MMQKNYNPLIGLIIDDDFAKKHDPPYPNPVFLSYETPLRISVILNYFERMNLFRNERIKKLSPRTIEEDILHLAHSQYHIDTIKRLTNFGGGILSEDVFIAPDTYSIAKKAVGGVIEAMVSVLENKVKQAFALVRPPGHHAFREEASGLCIFNNIATAIFYLREKEQYKKRIAIIDIDDHYGDGLARYFYEDPSVLYFSIHEFDFLEGDVGFISDIGAGDGRGTSINFPIPMYTTDEDFLAFFDVITPILNDFNPDLIVVPAGFDMYFADPVGNILLTSKSYYEFTKRLLQLAKQICDGKIVFSLEGGYNLIGLPICCYAIISALLDEKFSSHPYEELDFSGRSKIREITKIKKSLIKTLRPFWDSL
ncbi:MAG: histone deacetylase [Promethearchaeota archaeon]|nr:MAG: histone deacetylase [Candidatus Lokiarchaeota archaeon]